MQKAVDEKFYEVWADLTDGKTLIPQDKPLGVVLGGTPGAGKSILIADIKRRMNNNTIVINGDDFRVYHPNFKEIYQKYGANFPQYTSDFSNRMVERVIKEAQKKKLNLVVEGTFRKASTPINTLSELKENGYKTEAMIIVTDKKIAWTSTIERYEKDLKAGHYARKVDRTSFNEVAENLAKNVKIVLDTGKADRLTVYSREKQLFNSKKDNPEKIMQVINDELNGINQKKNLSKMLSEHLNTASKKLNDGKKHSLNNNIKMKI